MEEVSGIQLIIEDQEGLSTFASTEVMAPGQPERLAQEETKTTTNPNKKIENAILRKSLPMLIVKYFKNLRTKLLLSFLICNY